MALTPEEFAKKWRDSDRKERAASQQHFLELCELLDVPKPGDQDQNAKDYDFERAVKKPGERPGSVDVWRRGCFAWEYKGPRRSLVEAYRQLKDYADALDNPPLLVVSDMREIQVHTNFTNTAKRVHRIGAADLTAPETRRLLRNVFLDPEALRPDITRDRATAEAAAKIGELATQLRAAGIDPRRVAHFLNKLVFCMFAEDIGLLPDSVFGELVETAVRDGEAFEPGLRGLFNAMRHRGGMFGPKRIPWFNGGLFEDDDVVPLNDPQRRTLRDAALLDWSQIEPSIFGTLFERGLDPAKRKKMAGLFDAKGNGDGGKPTEAKPARGKPATGAADKGVGIHYTDPDKIMKIVEPVVLRPLRAEWEAVKAEVAKHRAAKSKAKSDAARTKAEDAARKAYHDFRARLGAYRVLDPACGSGNFLYLALLHLKDLDRTVEAEARAMGLPADKDRVTTDAVMGIEVNPYAAELAQLTIWIGEIQWQMKNAAGLKREPILGKLAQIECRDALLNEDGTEAAWPKADAIIGNPPFLGAKLMKRELKPGPTERLRKAFAGRLAGFTDLVCYWIEKAADQLLNHCANYVGFVATRSITGGTNRPVMDRIANQLVIYEAWSSLDWTLEGANVKVALVCYCRKEAIPTSLRLDGRTVSAINADLTTGTNATIAVPLNENKNVSFFGIQTSGPHDIDGSTARDLVRQPTNPNGRSNSEILKPYWNGDDVAGRPRDRWLIDFPLRLDASAAALWEAPFRYLRTIRYDPDSKTDMRTLPEARKQARDRHAQVRWWEPYWPRPEMRRKIEGSARYIVTMETSVYRLFVWLKYPVLPDKNLVVISRDDDTTFGVLHSLAHELWSRRLGTALVGSPRYTSSTTFETFPFPEGLTPNIPANEYANDPRARRIAETAKALNEQREAWLNPPDLVRRVPEVVPGYPDRLLPVSDAAEKILKTRTLTNLYNERPQWLLNAHRALDEAVAAAYGWPADLSDDDILARLLALNLERAKKQ